jgi:hypothetical protein
MTKGLFGQVESKTQSARTLGLRDQLTYRGNVSLGRHGWLRLTPAYSLHLVQELLRQSSRDELVLEPFSGTGTTPLACAAQGIRCHAVDINPFLVWLGNLKLRRFDAGTAEKVSTAGSRVAATSRKHSPDGWKPDLHAIEKWWDLPTLHTLAALREGIQQGGHTQSLGVTDLLNVAFCRVMIETANVSFAHQSMSFKKKGTDGDGRLFEESDAERSARVIDGFLAAVSDVAESLGIDPPVAESRIFPGDSRDLAVVLPEQSYTAVITSPPYPNRMSYIRELRPYMYWLGYLTNGRAAGELDWKAIGGTWGCATSLLNTWSPNGPGTIPYPQFERVVRDISANHALLGRYVHKYFEDIKEHIQGLTQVLAPGARCHYIVGNSKFYDTMLPVEEIYAALFEDAGFLDVRIETIRKRTSKKELFEFIVHAKMR